MAQQSLADKKAMVTYKANLYNHGEQKKKHVRTHISSDLEVDGPSGYTSVRQ